MNQLSPIQCQTIASASEKIKHGFFTRTGGVSTGIYKGLNVGVGSNDDKTLVRQNRDLVVAHFGLDDEDVITPWQIHSNIAVITSDHWKGERPKADAVVSNSLNLPIAIVTADCGPVLFAEPHANIVAAAHSGWRGATGGILEAAVDAMVNLGAAKSKIIATLGPTISQENYEVGPEFVETLLSLDSKNNVFLRPSEKADHALFDLPGYIVDRLTRYDVIASWTGHCTYADEENFYSYRRMVHRGEPDYGRQISAITIRS